MAWAQWLGGHEAGPAAADMAPGCHGHETPTSDHEPHPVPPTCCDVGGCSCAAPAVPSLNLSQAAHIPHPPLSANIGTSPPPAFLPDESLRPPID
jgi:hypothetical protein